MMRDPECLLILRRTPSRGVRVVAGVLLAAVALWFAPPSGSALKPASHGCSMSGDMARGPTLVAAAAEEPCHHAGYTGCAQTAACGGGSPAVQRRAFHFTLGGHEGAFELPQVRALPGLVGRGPPTPPPNS